MKKLILIVLMLIMSTVAFAQNDSMVVTNKVISGDNVLRDLNDMIKHVEIYSGTLPDSFLYDTVYVQTTRGMEYYFLLEADTTGGALTSGLNSLMSLDWKSVLDTGRVSNKFNSKKGNLKLRWDWFGDTESWNVPEDSLENWGVTQRFYNHLISADSLTEWMAVRIGVNDTTKGFPTGRRIDYNLSMIRIKKK